MSEFIQNDGGRSKYFKGNAGDCAVRALAIYSQKDYKQVYDSFNPYNVIGASPRNGSDLNTLLDVYGVHGLARIDIVSDELSVEMLSDIDMIIEYDKHVHACLKGVIHDTHEKNQPYEAVAIWVDKSIESAVSDRLSGEEDITAEPGAYGLTWVS